MTRPEVGVLVVIFNFAPARIAAVAAACARGSRFANAASIASTDACGLPSNVTPTERTIAGPSPSLRRSSSTDHGELLSSKLTYGQTVATAATVLISRAPNAMTKSSLKRRSSTTTSLVLEGSDAFVRTGRLDASA